MTEHGQDTTSVAVTEDMLREAELRRLNTETAKTEAELQEVAKRLNHKWWHIQLNTNLQVLISGIVGAILIMVFFIDTVNKMYSFASTQITVAENQIAKAEERNIELAAQQERRTAEYDRQLNALNAINEAQKVELSQIQTARKTELATLQSVTNKNEQQEAQIEELNRDLMLLSASATQADTRSDNIFMQQVRINLQKHPWRMSFPDRSTWLTIVDPFYTFLSDGKTKRSGVFGLTEKTLWQVEGEALVISDTRYTWTFPLTNVKADFIELTGTQRDDAPSERTVKLTRVEEILERPKQK